MKLIFGGHWTQPPEGWTVLTESWQDIRRPLRFADGSVEAIFTEHVIEHVTFLDAVFFFRECFRILQPNGIMRTVSPSVDALQRFGEYRGEHGSRMAKRFEECEQAYLRESVAPRYHVEDAVLQELHVNIRDPHVGVAFMFDSLLKLHGHRFVWSTGLLREVLVGLGYTEVRFYERPGEGPHALEHAIRGTPEEVVRAGLPPNAESRYVNFDPESLFCTAMKPK